MANRWARLAEAAAQDVNSRFGHRLMGLPGTWIGSLRSDPATENAESRRPAAVHSKATPWSEWHYWWQAHYLDAILDTGFQYYRAGSQPAARTELHRATRLLRGILIRNFCRFPNYFYDDMAWLTLASRRLNEFSLQVEDKPSKLASFATASLARLLHKGYDLVLGGGLYWSRKRDFKNTPANAPAALYLARSGECQTATALVEWLRRELFDPQLGLYLDGIRISSTGNSLESTIYTYNQGPVLAALLRLGRPRYVDQAAELIDAVKTHLSTPGQALRLEEGADGGLFTGILCRYLALAVKDEQLPVSARETAANLVLKTAEAIEETEPQELSAAVQRWTILSAAAGIDRG